MFVLDTNVLSDLMLSVQNPAVSAWTASQAREKLLTTSVSQAEILSGIASLPAGRRRDQLTQAADRVFAIVFRDRILAFDSAAANAFATIASTRRRAGRPIGTFDAQIAAITVSRRAALATRNVKDFQDCGLVLVNPWAFETTDKR